MAGAKSNPLAPWSNRQDSTGSLSTEYSTGLALICGDDDFAVKQRAKQIFSVWSAELGGMDHEIIDASVGNSGDALTALGKLREALHTLPFFGGGKVVWLRDCNFLGEERTASSAAVTETLAGSGGRTEKIFLAKRPAAHQRRQGGQAERLLQNAGKNRHGGKLFGVVAGRQGLGRIAPKSPPRTLCASGRRRFPTTRWANWSTAPAPTRGSWKMKLRSCAVFVGDRQKIELADVTTICSRNKTAKAFALGDALGDRDLPRLLQRLDEELWETKFDKDKSEIGLLYGLIGKVRAMLLLKEMLREGWIKETRDYNQFKAQLERVPADKLPADKKFNPLALNPYVLYKALPQVKKYTSAELVRAMDVLLRCNQRLVSSGLDEALVLQQALVQIVAPRRRGLKI